MLLALFAGCDDTTFKSHSVEVEGEGFEAVTEVFDANCIGCHGGPNPSASLALDGDLCDSLVGIETGSGTLVKAGDAEGSVLIGRITDADSPMPPPGLMAQGNIDIITDWIEAGAVCDADSAPDPNPDADADADTDDTGGPDEAPSFATIWVDIMEPNHCSACHDDTEPAGDLNLVDQATAYAALTDTDTDLVVSGNPDASYLVLKLRDDPTIYGDPMPPPADYDLIATEDLNIVIAWINGGAPE
jgi:mono/diheme cytochrome c family protein